MDGAKKRRRRRQPNQPRTKCVTTCKLSGGKRPRAMAVCRKAADWSALGEAEDRRRCSNDPAPGRGRRCRRLKGTGGKNAFRSSVYGRLCITVAEVFKGFMTYRETIQFIKRRGYLADIKAKRLTIPRAAEDARIWRASRTAEVRASDAALDDSPKRKTPPKKRKTKSPKRASASATKGRVKTRCPYADYPHYCTHGRNRGRCVQQPAHCDFIRGEFHMANIWPFTKKPK